MDSINREGINNKILAQCEQENDGMYITVMTVFVKSNVDWHILLKRIAYSGYFPLN